MTLKQLAWRLLALCFVALGVIGAFLPVMPTTVFMLLACWAAGNGWPELVHWIETHPQYGPPVLRWKQHRVIPRRAKWLALATMSLSAVMIAFTTLPLWGKGALWAFLVCVLAWLWSRPERIPGDVADRADDSNASR